MSHYVLQNDPRTFPRADEFLPERWLVEAGYELYPPKGAWRPFEHGTRLCLGQALVMSEIKAILACTVREYELEECYDEMDTAAGRKFDLSGVAGERAYMYEAGAAHPKGGYPCRVRNSGYVPGGGKVR